MFQKDLGHDGLPFEVIWGLFFKWSSPGLGIYEFVFHITVSENTTIQTSKRKQVSEFSFQDGKVISVVESEAILVHLNWIF